MEIFLLIFLELLQMIGAENGWLITARQKLVKGLLNKMEPRETKILAANIIFFGLAYIGVLFNNLYIAMIGSLGVLILSIKAAIENR